VPAIDVRHPGLPELFDPDSPNAPMLFGILEGRLPGRAVADDPANPRVAAVQGLEAIAFISRTDSQAAFDATLAELRRDAVVGLVWSETPTSSITPEPPARTMERLGFDPIDASSPRFEGLRAALPDGATVRPIDADLLDRCEWRDLVEAAHGSRDGFLANAFGLCLMRGDDILAEAYAPFIGRGVAEVGVVTAEAHRGQGLAAVAIAWLMVPVAEHGLAAYWSCDTTNEASIRVARKVGFGTPKPFGLWLYRPLEA
jgi:GNAT superfamily N-acetyltransferase